MCLGFGIRGVATGGSSIRVKKDIMERAYGSRHLCITRSPGISWRDLPLLDDSFGLLVEFVQIFHCGGIFKHFPHLDSCGDELKHVSVILQRPGLRLSSMTHLQSIVQYRCQFLYLAIVDSMGGYLPFSGQTLDEVVPFGPLLVGRGLHCRLVWLKWNGKAVFGNPIKCTLRETPVHLR